MINEVYNVVQEILNKNGYGLLTPTRFVHFAESAQLKVVGETIDDYRVAKRNAARYDASDVLNTMEAIIEIFADREMLSREVDGELAEYHLMPSDYMRWGSANVDDVEIVKLPSRMKAAVNRNYYVNPVESEPVCFIEGNRLYVYPQSIGVIDSTPVDEVELHYYRYPKKPNWTYEMVGKTPVFDSGSEFYQDFEVPASLFNKLVLNISALAGVHLKDADVVQYSFNSAEEMYRKENR